MRKNDYKPRSALMRIRKKEILALSLSLTHTHSLSLLSLFSDVLHVFMAFLRRSQGDRFTLLGWGERKKEREFGVEERVPKRLLREKAKK